VVFGAVAYEGTQVGQVITSAMSKSKTEGLTKEERRARAERLNLFYSWGTERERGIVRHGVG
jgi:hypothetical protein